MSPLFVHSCQHNARDISTGQEPYWTPKAFTFEKLTMGGRLAVLVLALAGLSRSAVLLGSQKDYTFGDTGGCTTLDSNLGFFRWSSGFMGALNDSCKLVNAMADNHNSGYALHEQGPLERRKTGPTKSSRPVSRADTSTTPADVRPTPEPTGTPSMKTTVYISNSTDFALLLPNTRGGLSSFNVF